MATNETAVHADLTEKGVSSAEQYTDVAISDIQSFAEYLSDELGLTSTSTYPSTPPTFIDLPEILFAFRQSFTITITPGTREQFQQVNKQ